MKPVEKVWGKILDQTEVLVRRRIRRLTAYENSSRIPAATSKTQDKATSGLPYPHFYPQAKGSIFGPSAANSVHNRDGDIFVNNHEEKLNNRYKTHSKTR